MRLLLLLFALSTLSSASHGPGILEILIESGASANVGFFITHENKTDVTWKKLESNTTELLIFEGFDFTRHNEENINITIHTENFTSNSVILTPYNHDLIVYDIEDLPLPLTGFQMQVKCAE